MPQEAPSGPVATEARKLKDAHLPRPSPRTHLCLQAPSPFTYSRDPSKTYPFLPSELKLPNHPVPICIVTSTSVRKHMTQM